MCALFLSSLFCPIGLFVCLYFSTTMNNASVIFTLQQVLKSGSLNQPILFLFLKIFLAVLDSLDFHLNFRISFYKKKLPGILIGIAFYLYISPQKMERIDILMVTPEHLFIEVSFNFSQQCFIIFSVQFWNISWQIIPR